MHQNKQFFIVGEKICGAKIYKHIVILMGNTKVFLGIFFKEIKLIFFQF
jgi:hypothetical protein